MSPTQAAASGPDLAHRFSTAARRLRPSAVRQLFSAASEPGTISFAGGMPDVSALPSDLLRQALDAVLRQEAATALQYGTAQGAVGLRASLCRLMAHEGILAAPEDVLVTAGGQQALDLLARALCDPGEAVLAEGPTYVGALAAFSQYGVEVRHVATDQGGLVPGSLAEELARLHAEGRRAGFLYTVPTYHNPTGATLDERRREEIVELARRHGLLLVEDDPYSMLGFGPGRPAALRARDADRVVYVGSLSKTLCPGLRLGWINAPRPVLERCTAFKEAADLCSPALSQAVARRLLDDPAWPDALARLRRGYRAKRDALLSALERHLPPGAVRGRPEGGFFLWADLGPHVDAADLLPRALARGVAYVPGSAFYADGRGGSRARLSYCLPALAEIETGVERLSRALAETPAARRPALATASP